MLFRSRRAAQQEGGEQRPDEAEAGSGGHAERLREGGGRTPESGSLGVDARPADRGEKSTNGPPGATGVRRLLSAGAHQDRAIGPSREYRLGGWPTWRLKAVLKVLAEL